MKAIQVQMSLQGCLIDLKSDLSGHGWEAKKREKLSRRAGRSFPKGSRIKRNERDANKAKKREREMGAVKGNTGEVKMLVMNLKSADSAPPGRPKGGGYLL